MGYNNIFEGSEQKFKKRGGIYSESKCAFKKTSNHFFICMHSETIPTWIGNHDSRNTFDDWTIVTCHMYTKQTMSINNCIVFIDSFYCPTISYIMLSTSSHFLPVTNNSDEARNFVKMHSRFSNNDNNNIRVRGLATTTTTYTFEVSQQQQQHHTCLRFSNNNNNNIHVWGLATTTTTYTFEV